MEIRSLDYRSCECYKESPSDDGHYTFLPTPDIVANKGKRYQDGTEYSGGSYSSVKEFCTYVGQDVSFGTYMTALHNPTSIIYTERINELPYHGTNGRGY